ncbi:MAG: hypothetical protein HY290_31705 [Planctomycetia bacterium]|nr:hypothetical protein [Planctomycetia bacterium]
MNFVSRSSIDTSTCGTLRLPDDQAAIAGPYNAGNRIFLPGGSGKSSRKQFLKPGFATAKNAPSALETLYAVWNHLRQFAPQAFSSPQ